ncbi:MAG: DUF2505 domain-containing protein [Marmoricola sp.]
MSRKINHEMRYDGATPEQVHAMLADPKFREAVCEFTGFRKHAVTITPKGATMAVRIDQHRPATEVPSFARKLVGEEINVVQEESWTSTTAAALTVTIPGRPGHMHGTIELVGDANGTTEVVAVEVKVNVPLVGGKLEGFIGDMLMKALRAENKVGRDWLAGSSG